MGLISFFLNLGTDTLAAGLYTHKTREQKILLKRNEPVLAKICSFGYMQKERKKR